MVDATEKKSVYDQLGGEAAVDIAVDKFYEKVLADPLVNGFFKDTDMKKQAAHQKAFLTVNTPFKSFSLTKSYRLHSVVQTSTLEDH